MNRILVVVIVVLTILITAKFFLKDQSRGIKDGPPPIQSLASTIPEEDACIPMNKFMVDYPDATPEQIYEMEECNRNRNAKLGLDKRNTGFLGNRNIRPEGALAHYEGGYGSFEFTLYKDHISAKDIDGNHAINIFSIKTVKKSGSTIIIEYETESGKLKRYGVTLMGRDDELKAEGNTDLDRIIDLINQLRGEYE